MARELKSDRILREMNDLSQELRKHQERCKHKNATYISKGDTGNWCRDDDSYWQEWKCPTCKKSWMVDV